MAPKKPAPGKKEPAGKDAAKGDAAPPGDLLNKVKDFILSPAGTYIGIMLCTLLCAAALGVLILYAIEIGKTARLRYGAQQIADFIDDREPHLKESPIYEKIKAAQTYAETLAAWTAKTIEVEKEIDEVNSKIVKDWNVYDGSIYLFDRDRRKFKDAITFCENHKSTLTSIDSEVHEEYIESNIKGKHVPYWLGLHWENDNWVWLDKRPLTEQFWAPNEPSSTRPRIDKCVYIDNMCKTSRKCWKDSSCNEIRRAICRRRPNKKWDN